MLINELLHTDGITHDRAIATIRARCDQYLRESAHLPLYKLLPKAYDDFQRVKVRQQKKTDVITEAFNAAFDGDFNNIRQRAVFTTPALPQATDSHEPFYIFPTNGFKFLYSKEVKDSSSDYKRVIDTLFERLDNNDKAIEIVTDLLKLTYNREHLLEGIMSESEIIIYGIPQYYALRVSSVAPYGKIFHKTT